MNNKNYSLVAYLTGEEYKKARQLQEELAEITGSRKSLEDWLPHITVGDAIIVSDSEIQKLENDLLEFAHSKNSIKISTKSFGGTNDWKGAVGTKLTSHAIWIEVDKNADLLELFDSLKTKITSQYDTWLKRIVNYSPHITLGFATLSEDGYKKGLEYLSSKKLELNFSINHISLVECYGEGNMVSKEYKRFYFNK